MPHGAAAPFPLESLGLVMEADAARPDECEGVLNPAAARGPDGALYLFPRLVGRGNYSRVGCARVHFDGAGHPARVERLGYALEPSAPYELRPEQQSGGCEDPRITYVELLQLYVMVYAAWGAGGPRLALAVSEDLRAWRRLGLITFAPAPDPLYGVDFAAYHNKDGALFPQAVTGPDGGQRDQPAPLPPLCIEPRAHRRATNAGRLDCLIQPTSELVHEHTGPRMFYRPLDARPRTAINARPRGGLTTGACSGTPRASTPAQALS